MITTPNPRSVFKFWEDMTPEEKMDLLRVHEREKWARRSIRREHQVGHLLYFWPELEGASDTLTRHRDRTELDVGPSSLNLTRGPLQKCLL